MLSFARRGGGERSDRLIRVARVIAAAENTFGSTEKAHRWLRRPTTVRRRRGARAPRHSEGSRQVERLLFRIDHGVAA